MCGRNLFLNSSSESDKGGGVLSRWLLGEVYLVPVLLSGRSARGGLSTMRTWFFFLGVEFGVDDLRMEGFSQFIPGG